MDALVISTESGSSINRPTASQSIKSGMSDLRSNAVWIPPFESRARAPFAVISCNPPKDRSPSQVARYSAAVVVRLDSPSKERSPACFANASAISPLIHSKLLSTSFPLCFASHAASSVSKYQKLLSRISPSNSANSFAASSVMESARSRDTDC